MLDTSSSSRMETASKVEAVSMARSVSKEGSFEDVLGSIDNLSLEA